MMDDEFETEVEDEESITPRKFDRWTFITLWLQHRAAKKMVKSDLYSSFADALLMHRAHKESSVKFQEKAAREIEALVTAVERVNSGPAE
jgi:hypothetical protein